jgi:hypothetical protein
MTFTLYTPPTVTLTVFFEFSVRFKYGLVLDTKGIREAIEQKKPEKALNSFALKDTFDGVDEPLVTMTATVGFEVEVSAVIVAVSVGGSITLTATIDFYDPYPDTSGGLVRPFEMFSFSKNPVDWFEFTVSLTLELFVSIKIGIFFGFGSITLYEYKITFSIELIPLLYIAPGAPDPIVTCNDDKSMTILNLPGSKNIQCTSLDGSVGDETIECIVDDFIQSCYNVNKVETQTGQVNNLILRDVQSPTDIQFNFASTHVMELDYKAAGLSVLSDDVIVISEKKALVGTFTSKFTTDSAILLLPKPDKSFLTTTIGGNCNTAWTLEGHTNLEVKVAEIKTKCNIIATGGVLIATAFIDFSSGSRRELKSCGANDGYDITITTKAIAAIAATDAIPAIPARETIDIQYMEGSTRKNIEIAELFHSLQIKGSECADTILIEKTLDNGGSISFDGFGGDNEITVGSSDGLDSIRNKIIIKGGDGMDTLKLNNAGSLKANPSGVLTSSMVSGLTKGQLKNGTRIDEIEFEKIEVLEITLSSSLANDFTITSSPQKSDTTIRGSGMSDTFYVKETQGDLTLHAGGGNDEIYITGLADSATAVIYGDAGEDYLEVDGRGSTLVNTLNTSTVRWNGGGDNDDLKMFFTSTGNTVVDIFGDNSGSNTLQVECVDFDSTVLSRATFIANIHDSKTKSSERINFQSTDGNLASVLLNLNGGKNKAYFDDTMAEFTVFGGDNADGKRSGMFRLFIVFAAY